MKKIIFTNNFKLLTFILSLSLLSASNGYSSEKVEPLERVSHQSYTLNPKQVELVNSVNNDDLPTVKYLINREKVSENTQDLGEDANSLLHLAIQRQKWDIFNFLLKINADTNIQNYYGETPLHEAAAKGYKTFLDELLEEESTNVNTQDMDGNTAFHKAIQKKHLDCVSSFIKIKTFDYTLRNKKNMTVIDMLDHHMQVTTENTDITHEIKDQIARIANLTVNTILKQDIPFNPSIQKMAERIIQHNKKFFFSYSWNNEYSTKPMVDDFEKFINKKLGIKNYYRDVREEESLGMTSGTHIEGFMKNAREADVVVIFLNDAYLRSRNCMYEFLQVWNEETKKISPKTFIVRHPDFNSMFGGPSSAISYSDHWEVIFKNLRSKDVSASDMHWLNTEEGFIIKVRTNIIPIIKEITSHIRSDYSSLRSNGFEDICKVALRGEDEDYDDKHTGGTIKTLSREKHSLKAGSVDVYQFITPICSLLTLEEHQKLAKESEICLFRKKLGDGDLKILTPLLEHNQNLTMIDLFSNNVSTNGVRILSSLPYLKNLRLEQNPIGDEGAMVFQTNTTLKILNLFNAEISDLGAVSLARNSTLQELGLYKNSITDCGAFALSCNRTLKKLDLRRNSISDKGTQALALAHTLEVLFLARNDITDKGAKAFINKDNFTQVDLKDTKVSEETVKLFEKTFPHIVMK